MAALLRLEKVLAAQAEQLWSAVEDPLELTKKPGGQVAHGRQLRSELAVGATASKLEAGHSVQLAHTRSLVAVGAWLVNCEALQRRQATQSQPVLTSLNKPLEQSVAHLCASGACKQMVAFRAQTLQSVQTLVT